jgi:hypothetical protein
MGSHRLLGALATVFTLFVAAQGDDPSAGAELATTRAQVSAGRSFQGRRVVMM